MVYAWQLWLSPRPTQRTKYVHEENVLVLASSDGKNAGSAAAASPRSDDHAGQTRQMLYEFHTYKGHSTVRETHYINNKTVREGKSGPPLHIHLRQAETFEVVQGVLGVVKNGVEHAVRKEDGPVSIHPGERHTFWAHSTCTEDLIFNVFVEPEGLDHGFDESFLRNLTGYQRDCERHGVAPSLFQMLLFMYDGDMVITPPFWTPLWLLKGLHHVLGYWVGAGLLGYQASYPEYSTHHH